MTRHIVIILFVLGGLTMFQSAFGHSRHATAYFAHGQYSAILEQRTHHWLLQPLDGPEVSVSTPGVSCAGTMRVPRGVWIVSRDAHGRPKLVAPSAIRLPPGFPQGLPLRACGDPDAKVRALFVPAIVLDWIGDHVGSVMIDD